MTPIHPRRLTPLRLVAITIAILAAGGAAAYVLHTPDQGGIRHVPPVASGISPGDEVAIRFTLIGTDGRPFYTSDPSVAVVLNLTDPTYVRREADYYSARPFIVGEAQHFLGDAFVQSLMGREAGETFMTRLFASEELGHAWKAGQKIKRVWGPYPLVESADADKFRQRIPNATVGETFKLNYRFNATLLSEKEGKATFRLNVKDGSSEVVEGLGSARLVTRVDETAGTFTQTLTATPGDTFPRKNARLFELPPGSYRVDDLDERYVYLSHADTRNLEVVGRDASVLVHVLSVEKPAHARVVGWDQ